MTPSGSSKPALAVADPTGPPLRLVRHPVNRGKGASVRTGVSNATKDIVLFTDADLSAPMSEAPKLIEAISSRHCDVAIGSRALDPSLIDVHQGVIRRNSGRVFNRMVRCLTGLDLWDTQCGFKGFRRAPWRRPSRCSASKASRSMWSCSTWRPGSACGSSRSRSAGITCPTAKSRWPVIPPGCSSTSAASAATTGAASTPPKRRRLSPDPLA